MRRRPTPIVRTVIGALVAAWAGLWLLNRSLVRVEGRSMLPTLAPGDRVLTVPARLPGVLRAGKVVVCPDPRAPDRMILKRVAAVEDGGVWLTGDNPDESTDSRVFGLVPRGDVRRVVVARIGASRGQVRDRSQGAGALGGGLG